MMSRPARLRNLLLLALCAATSSAMAHTAPSGWDYDPACCSGRDCAPVASSMIRASPSGYLVEIPAGGHPFVSGQPLSVLIPYSDPRVRPSGDGEKHACIGPSRHVFCIYVPPGGV